MESEAGLTPPSWRMRPIRRRWFSVWRERGMGVAPARKIVGLAEGFEGGGGGGAGK